MKSTGHIFLFLAVLFLSSCLSDWEEPTMAAPVETSWLMQITVKESDDDAVDKMETVRFFVFKNANSNGYFYINNDDEVRLKIAVATYGFVLIRSNIGI